MFRNIEWLFFDVGSTLINEEKVYKHIFYDIADATGESYEKIYDMAIRFYKENKKGDLELAKMYGIPALNSVCSTITFLAKFSLDWLDSDWHSASRMMHDFPTLQLQC